MIHNISIYIVRSKSLKTYTKEHLNIAQNHEKNKDQELSHGR